MIDVLDFKRGKQIYEIIYEQNKYWVIFKTIGKVELGRSEILYKANTLKELEKIAPEFFI